MAIASPSGDDAPQNPQNSPPQGANQPPDQGGGEIQKLIMNVGGALSHIQQIIQQTQGTTPQEKQMIGQILEMYTDLVKSLSGDGAPPDQGQSQGQPAPMEVGANKGAQPAM